MQPPIFVFDEDEHDLWVFKSVEHAASFLEPWNMNTARIYDRHATALKAFIERKKGFWTTSEFIVLQEESPRRTDEADLRPPLIEYLKHFEEMDDDKWAQMSLSDLADRAALHTQ